MKQPNHSNKIKELLLLLKSKHYVQQDLWNALGVWNNIPDGRMTILYRHGRAAKNIYLDKLTIIQSEDKTIKSC